MTGMTTESAHRDGGRERRRMRRLGGAHPRRAVRGRTAVPPRHAGADRPDRWRPGPRRETRSGGRAEEPPLVVALGRVGRDGHATATGTRTIRSPAPPGRLVVAYTRRTFDEPVPADRLTLDGPVTPLDRRPSPSWPHQLGPRPGGRTWLVSLDLPIEAASPAEAVRLFWSYVQELGPRELPPSSRRPVTSWPCRRSCSGVRGQPGPGRGRLTPAVCRVPTHSRHACVPRRPASLGHERGGGGPVVGGGAADGLRLRLGGQRVRQGAGVADGELPLDRPVRDGRAGGEPGGQLLGGRQHLLVVVDQPGQQAQPVRLLGAHRLGQHQQLDRLGVADEPGQRPGDAGVGGQPDLGEGHQEAGPRPADPEVGQEGQRGAGARRPCRGPRPPPAWAGWPAARRSGCSAPAPCPAGRCRRSRGCRRARAGPDRRRTPRPAPASTTARQDAVGLQLREGVPQRLLERHVERVHRLRAGSG